MQQEKGMAIEASVGRMMTLDNLLVRSVRHRKALGIIIREEKDHMERNFKLKVALDVMRALFDHVIMVTYLDILETRDEDLKAKAHSLFDYLRDEEKISDFPISPETLKKSYSEINNLIPVYFS
ncbi:hypothetical protein HY404_01560 [Candidatus Microgenomates bacterium]|nr:hypothetical protein [Candidatus Microgenomates bacterium]